MQFNRHWRICGITLLHPILNYIIPWCQKLKQYNQIHHHHHLQLNRKLVIQFQLMNYNSRRNINCIFTAECILLHCTHTKTLYNSIQKLKLCISPFWLSPTSDANLSFSSQFMFKVKNEWRNVAHSSLIVFLGLRQKSQDRKRKLAPPPNKCVWSASMHSVQCIKLKWPN